LGKRKREMVKLGMAEATDWIRVVIAAWDRVLIFQAQNFLEDFGLIIVKHQLVTLCA
jgi:hypothetical protein